MHDRSDVSEPLQVTDNVTWFLSSMRTFPFFFNIDFPINFFVNRVMRIMAPSAAVINF